MVSWNEWALKPIVNGEYPFVPLKNPVNSSEHWLKVGCRFLILRSAQNRVKGWVRYNTLFKAERHAY